MQSYARPNPLQRRSIRWLLASTATLLASAMFLLGPSYFGPIAYAITGASLLITGIVYGGRSLVAVILATLIIIVVVGRFGLTCPLGWTAEPIAAPIQLLIHDPSDPGPAGLRAEFGIDQVVANTQGLDRLLTLTRWVNSQWTHSGSNQPERSDPSSILREAKAGASFRCVEYGIVLTGAAQALDMPARILGLKTRWAATARSGAGHVVAEVWLDDYDKWVMVDPQYGYAVESDGIPVSAVELQQALAHRRSVRVMSADGPVSWLKATHYLIWLAPYLYHFDFGLDQRVFLDPGERTRGALMLVPPGAPELEVFQRRFPLRGYTFTSDLNVFYPDLSGRSGDM